MKLEAIVGTVLLLGIICEGTPWGPDKDEDRCEAAIKETIQEDHSTIVDETPNRLHSTWLSQECEVWAGPEYVIRKYTFFENGTFLLLRHHYAEESCTVAMYTVSARGVIRLVSDSSVAPGATEARYQLDQVHIVPLTRQVAQKFSHRVNVSCIPQPRWRPYAPQLIYEQPSKRFSNFLWQGPKYNLFQPRHYPTSKKHRGLDCLDAFGIGFGELRLVRVQKKASTKRAFLLGSNNTPRVELFLGSLPPNVYSRKTHRSTSLQPISLLRADTINGCLVCGAISRGTETSPPLLHEVAALPALLGGSWLSSSCESCEGGLWIKRQLEMYAGDTLWTGRWDYYRDPRCSNFLYAVTAAGSYVQRPGRQRRNEAPREPDDFRSLVTVDEDESSAVSRSRRDLEAEVPVEMSLKNENEASGGESDENDPEKFTRTRKTLAEWMTLGLAKNLFEIYGWRKEMSETMLPTVEELREAIGKSEPSDEAEASVSPGTGRKPRSLEAEDSYRHLLQNAKPSMADAFTAMLRGNQRREETTRRPVVSSVPSGTTELDLHVAESLLIAGDLGIAARCGAHIFGDDRGVASRGLRVRPLANWPRNCVKHALEAPSTLGLRARVGVNWSGQYTLLLGPRDDHLWEAPLHQCGPTPPHNPVLRAHLRRSVGIRYGLYTTSSQSRTSGFFNLSLLQQIFIFLAYFYLR